MQTSFKAVANPVTKAKTGAFHHIGLVKAGGGDYLKLFAECCILLAVHNGWQSLLHLLCHHVDIAGNTLQVSNTLWTAHGAV